VCTVHQHCNYYYNRGAEIIQLRNVKLRNETIRILETKLEGKQKAAVSSSSSLLLRKQTKKTTEITLN